MGLDGDSLLRDVIPFRIVRFPEFMLLTSFYVVVLRTIMVRAYCFVHVTSLITAISKEVFSRGFVPSQFRSYTERQNRRSRTLFRGRVTFELTSSLIKL